MHDQYPSISEFNHLEHGGYENAYDRIFGADLAPESVPPDLERYYVEVGKSLSFLPKYLGLPRYTFVCPCCNTVFPDGSRPHRIRDFRLHIKNYLYNGGGCSLVPKVKPLVTERRVAKEGVV